MYSIEFWKEFNTRPELSSNVVNRVVTNNFVYQITNTDNPLLNKVLYIQDGNLDDIFKELNEIFKDKANGFEVGVRQTDHPDLHNYLLNHGYKKTVVSENRVLKLTEKTIKELQLGCNNKYVLKELSIEDLASDEIFELLLSCFPELIKTKEQHDSMYEIMFDKADGMGSTLKNYALYDQNIPVAFGSLFDIGKFNDYHLAMLSGAGTHPSYRKQGLYTTMLYHRCREALQNGVNALFIQADIETSSPIVAKYGFQLVEVITEYQPVKV
jgi:predicted GNAT family acetyltransferase